MNKQTKPPDEKTSLVEKANATQLVSVETMLENCVPELAKLLGDDGARRMTRIITTDMRMTPDLALCTPLSMLGAVFTTAELELEPVAGRAWILPFNNKKKIANEWRTVKEAQFVLGYRGIVDLFYRHASAIGLSWGVVHENDEFEYEKGSNNFLRHKRALKDRGAIVAYWVGADVNGKFLFEVMTLEECMEHGKEHSKTFDKRKGVFYDSSPWVKSPDSMCKKTVLIQLSKTLPLSVKVQRALQADESTRYVSPDELKKVDSVLELPDQTNWDKEGDDES